VWHVENGRRCLFEEFRNRSDSDPSLRLERISTAKNRFYITLDCDKRLKVQRLVLVAILRVNGEIFVSEDAHFPPPSSKRGASPRLKGRTGPYETLLSFSDMAADDDLRNSPRQSSSPPTSGRRRASSVKSTSYAASSSPRSGSSADVNSWQTLVKWLLESRHSNLPSALLLQHLAQLSSIAIDFGTLSNSSSPAPTPRAAITIEGLREELIEWLETGPYHIMELLEAGILQQCIMEPWFLGNINEGGAQSYLHWYCQRANLQSAFLVRFSSPNFPHIHPITYPHLVIDAIWTNEQTNSLERYSAPVLYDFDANSQLYFWIETVNDSLPSRSNSLADVVRYICNTTGWSHVWRNPPPTPAYLSSFQPQPASPTALFSPQSPLVAALASSSDAIGHQKHRSMPLLLHSSSPSRLRATSTTSIISSSSSSSSSGGSSSTATPQSSSQGYNSNSNSNSNSNNSSNNNNNNSGMPGPSHSPMLTIPSKIGLLPHDPAAAQQQQQQLQQQQQQHVSSPSSSTSTVESPHHIDSSVSTPNNSSNNTTTTNGSTFAVWTANTSGPSLNGASSFFSSANNGSNLNSNSNNNNNNNESLNMDAADHFDMTSIVTSSNTLHYDADVPLDPSDTSDTSLMDADPSSFQFHTHQHHLQQQQQQQPHHLQHHQQPHLLHHPPVPSSFMMPQQQQHQHGLDNGGLISSNGGGAAPASYFHSYEPSGFMAHSQPSDSIAGVRSLSAPTALRTWSLNNSSHNSNGYDQSVHVEANPSPAPFYMPSQTFSSPYNSMRSFNTAPQPMSTDLPHHGMMTSDSNRFMSFKTDNYNSHVLPPSSYDLHEASQ